VNVPPGRPRDHDGVPEIRPARTDGVLNSATLAGGCFWCLEAVYLQLKGVVGVKSGYAGGRRPNPTYEQVCSGATGHAEVVQVTYDPGQIGYGDLLDVFFTIHDPTTLNRQGADSGTQYRSAIFFESPDQERKARAKIAALEAEHVWDDPIVTEIVPLTQFWPAENYHDDYFAKNPRNPYCAAVIAPKVAKARKHFFEKLAK
jgi:peptide-methionine (S)-S-oxide reductase